MHGNYHIVLLHLCARRMPESQFLSKKKSQKASDTLSVFLQHIHGLQMHRILTDFCESSITLFNVDVTALNLYSCSLNECQGGNKNSLLLDHDVPCGEYMPTFMSSLRELYVTAFRSDFSLLA